ncbi:alginate export family protein [Aquimarina sp. MMG016]|uniref:alginate export family protein n=1 Tax=Aquimarina sp. MMG016 TaxID=2822690 RepID=UPI001B3A68C9|nr:alginate export family protein [Aquimarina sp. MMG016]MBQ4821082.1 alginate export family protein [Aquimarina sp. MMG016]
MKNTLNFTILIFLVLAFKGKAQELSIDADYRARYDYRHGFHNLVPQGVEPASLVEQRARLKFGYTSEKFKAHLSFQDVSVWGDTRQILPTDSNDSFQIAEAWVQLKLSESWATKVGRQTLSYDDQRILGGLDWAMQGRFHDAALIKYAKGKSKLDVGFSFSQNSGSANPANEFGNVFDVTGFFTYKALEFAHYNIAFTENNSLSILAMNNTFQNIENGIAVEGFFHRHTFGAYGKFKLGGVGLATSAYYQAGKANQNTDLSAYLLSAEGIYKAGATKIGLGFEIQSGTDQNSTDDKNKSFFPLYGTNHKFNGYMDYFYVGNHANSVGLTDIYGKAIFKTGKKSSLLVKAHYFGAAATLINDNDGSEADSYLGTEVDIVFTQKLLPYATLKVGYSQMFASENMEFLKNQPDPSGLQNWGWAMLVVKPNFLKWSPKPSE